LTLFPQETRTITARFRRNAGADHPPSLRLEGYNVEKQILPLRPKQ
jgi:hypothetical protein